MLHCNMFEQIKFTLLYSSPHKMTRLNNGVLMMTKCLGQQNLTFLTEEPDEDTIGINTTEQVDKIHKMMSEIGALTTDLSPPLPPHAINILMATTRLSIENIISKK